MKKISLLTLALAIGATAFAQGKWEADKAHSKVGFTVTHLSVSEVDGNFKKFDASITSTKADFTDAVFEMNADVASVNTDNDFRDNDLKSDHFFDVAKFPTMHFISKSVSKVDDKHYKITGDLTMHGVTKSVTLDMAVNGFTKDMRSQKPVAGIKVTGKLNRNDFGVGHMPSAMVSDDVEIRAVGEFHQQ